MEYFAIADKYFLAVSNFQSHLRGDWSQLFISGTDKSLLFLKTLQRDRGASKLKFFKIGNESFLAIVNLDNVGQETVDLVIYKWRNNSFDKFSEIPPTLGGAASFAIKNKTFISFRGYSAGGKEVVREGVLQTTNHTNVWSSRCEVVSNEWSNIPCNCKLNWWWKETQHF